MSEERELISSEERDAAASGDDVEGHMLSSEERGAVEPGAVEPGAMESGEASERRAFPAE